MPTKFPRKRCCICNKLHVSWKMPSFGNGEKIVFFCWQCSKDLLAKLITFNFNMPPNKKQLLARAFKIIQKQKPKQEAI